MRWLLVAHHLPPRHRAGVEVHTLAFAEALRAAGEDVHLYATDDDPLREPFTLRTETLVGLPVHLLAHPRLAPEPLATLGTAREEEAFRDVLASVQPEVVHFQHLMYVGLDAARLARASGAATMLTLYEYWMLCARNGQMIREDGALCAQAEDATCAACLGSHRFGRGAVEWRLVRAAAEVAAWSGWDVFPLLKRWQAGIRGGAAPARQPHALTAFLRMRRQRMEEALTSMQRILCPSAFLRDMFLRAFPQLETRLIVWPNGVVSNPRDGGTLSAAHCTLQRPLRVGFMGTVTPQKGADVLLRAVGELPAGAVQVVLFGSVSHEPSFVADLARLSKGDVTFAGAFTGPPSEALARMDVLVVPSRWYENAPFVITEAFAAGVPVVCSDIGGMREMVRHEVDGLHFSKGDAHALATQLHRLATEDGLLQRLAAGIDVQRSLRTEVRDAITLARGLVARSSR